MADQIGQLGLDLSDFDRAVNQAIENMATLGAEAAFASGNLAAMAVVAGGVLAAGIYKSRQMAEELNQTLQDIKNSNAFDNQYVSVSNLENRLKQLNAEIKKMDESGVGERIFKVLGNARILGGTGRIDDVDKADDEARAKFYKEIEETANRIGKKQEDQTRIIQLQAKGMDQEADLLKNQLKYREQIGSALEKGQGMLAYNLAKEKQITDEIIRQKYAKDAAGPSYQENLRRVDRETQDQRDSDAKQMQEQRVRLDKEARMQREFDERQVQENRVRQDNEGRELRENMEDEYKKWLVNEDNKKRISAEIRADTSAKVREENEKEAQAMDREETLRLKRNKEITAEIRQQTIEIERARMGNQTQARRRSMEDEFIRKIAQNAGNPQAIAELEEQRNQMRQDLDIEEMNKSSAQRRAERAQDRRRGRDERRLDNRNAELDRRLDRGARGSENSELERRRLERASNSLNQTRQRRALAMEEYKGFGSADSKNLSEIAAAYRAKTGGG